MSKSRFLVVVSIVLLMLPVIQGIGGDEKPRNIILIGWDGAQRNHIKECLNRGELPNLKKLSSAGKLVDIDVVRVTDTKAGWSQILTGYEPEITGVFNNGLYQPIPKGYTVFERLEDFFGKDNIATVAVIGKKGHVDDDSPKKIRIEDNEEETDVQKNLQNKKKLKAQSKNKNQSGELTAKKGKIEKVQEKKNKQKEKIKTKIQKQPEGTIVVENGIKYRVIPGKPYYYTKDNMDLFMNGLMEDERVGSTTLNLLEKYKDKRLFFFVHFAQVDHMGHRYGENSKEYNDALKSGDFWTGKIMQKLKDLNLYDKTIIYVTADHGFDEGMKGHRDAPYVFLATNDSKVIRRRLRVDITPTILDRFGVDIDKIKPPLDGHPLTKPYQPPIW